MWCWKVFCSVNPKYSQVDLTFCSNDKLYPINNHPVKQVIYFCAMDSSKIAQMKHIRSVVKAEKIFSWKTLVFLISIPPKIGFSSKLMVCGSSNWHEIRYSFGFQMPSKNMKLDLGVENSLDHVSHIDQKSKSRRGKLIMDQQLVRLW